jgi:hypothetical protein
MPVVGLVTPVLTKFLEVKGRMYVNTRPNKQQKNQCENKCEFLLSFLEQRFQLLGGGANPS